MSLQKILAFKKFSKVFACWSTEEGFLNFTRSWGGADPRLSIKNKCKFNEINAKGTKIYQFAPKHDSKKSKWHILYFYGSCHVLDATVIHFKYFVRFVKKTGVTINMPLLPITKQLNDPNFSRFKVYEACINAYKELLKITSPENIIIAGDSSGGGLALLMPTLLKDHNLPNPNKIFLMNPLSNCDLSDYQSYMKNNKMLFPKEGLLTAIKMFTKGDDIKDPYISPYFTDFKLLPQETYLFYGTYEESLLEMRRLEKKLNEHNKLAKCFVYKKLFHDFFCIPIPESNRYLHHIKSILNA